MSDTSIPEDARQSELSGRESQSFESVTASDPSVAPDSVSTHVSPAESALKSPPARERYPMLHFASAFYHALGWTFLLVIPLSVIARSIIRHEGIPALQARIWNLNLVWFIIAVVTSFALGEGCRLLLDLANDRR